MLEIGLPDIGFSLARILGYLLSNLYPVKLPARVRVTAIDGVTIKFDYEWQYPPIDSKPHIEALNLPKLSPHRRWAESHPTARAKCYSFSCIRKPNCLLFESSSYMNAARAKWVNTEEELFIKRARLKIHHFKLKCSIRYCQNSDPGETNTSNNLSPEVSHLF